MCLKSVFPQDYIDFTTLWLLRAQTLGQLQPVTLLHSEKPKSSEKESKESTPLSESGVDVSVWTEAHVWTFI